MIVEKVTWATHGERGDLPILSLDIHPDNTRFVTSSTDTHIKIWRLKPLQDGTCTPEELKPLADLVVHQHAVNCVRFSPNGLYLAAASDDFSVSLHKFVGIHATPNMMTLSGSPQIENWKVVKLFREHTKDVLSVDWHRNSEILASCSLDNIIIIYNVTTFQTLQRLEGHHGFVKGLSFDPIGRYLASQGENTLIVWKVNGWTEEKRITDHFHKQSSDMFLRPHWSADGMFLIGVDAFSGRSPIAPIFDRSTNFTSAFELSGHKLPIVVARFNPCLFENEQQKPEGVFALGSQDNTVTIWKTGMKRPLARLIDFFDTPILDISWSYDGRTMLCCAHRGAIVYLGFQKTELGNPISKEKYASMLDSLYGSGASSALNTKVYTHRIAETPSMINSTFGSGTTTLHTPLVRPVRARTSSSGNNTESSSSSSASELISKQQVEERTSSGKRRIRPIVIKGSDDDVVFESPTIPEPVDVSAVFASAAASPIVLANGNAPTSLPSTTTSATIASSTRTEVDTTVVELPAPPPPPPPVAALLILNGTPSPSRAPKGTISITESSAPAAKSTSSASSKTKKDKEKETVSKKRKQPEPERADEPEKSSVVKKKKKRGQDDTATTTPERQTTVESAVKPLPADVRLGPAEAIECSTDGTVKYKNRTLATNIPPPNELWTATIGAGSLVHQVVGNARFIAIAASNPNALHIFSKSGKRICPPIILSGKVEHMKCNSSSHIVICTDDRLLSLFDVAKLKCTIQTSVQPLLSPLQMFRQDEEEVTQQLDIISIGTTENGIPVVSVSSGSSYLYSIDLKSWTCIVDHRTTLSPFSSIAGQDNTTDNTSAVSLSSLRRLAASATPISAHVSELQQSSTKMSIQTKEDLEIALFAAQLMNSRTDYVHYLKLYALHLVTNADTNCLKELCDSLLGPVDTTTTTTAAAAAPKRDWDPYVLGLSKRSLLLDIIATMEANNKLQRLAAEYRQILGIQKQQHQQLQSLQPVMRLTQKAPALLHQPQAQAEISSTSTSNSRDNDVRTAAMITIRQQPLRQQRG